MDKTKAKDNSTEEEKIKYKIPFREAHKIDIAEMKCGNCGAKDRNVYSCKYNITEYDEFAKKDVDKTKSAKICGRCKWYLEKYIIPNITKKEEE